MSDIPSTGSRRRGEGIRSTSSGNVLPVEDLERLLQGLDLLLPPGDAFLVADARAHTRGLQLLEVGERGVQLFLRAVEVLLLQHERLLLVLLLGGLVLDVFVLGRFIDLGVRHELIVVLLRSLLCPTSFFNTSDCSWSC